MSVIILPSTLIYSKRLKPKLRQGSNIIICGYIILLDMLSSFQEWNALKRSQENESIKFSPTITETTKDLMAMSYIFEFAKFFIKEEAIIQFMITLNTSSSIPQCSIKRSIEKNSQFIHVFFDTFYLSLIITTSSNTSSKLKHLVSLQMQAQITCLYLTGKKI